MDINAIKGFLLPYVELLRHFNFTYDNPLFWAGVIVLFFILSRFWFTRNAFTFSLLVALILLGMTKLEDIIAGSVLANNGQFDPTLFRVMVGFIIGIIFIYYTFMKES